MSTNKNDALSRSDRVLVAALAIVLATASAAVGSALTYRPAVTPSTEHAAALAAPAVSVIDARAEQDRVLVRLLDEHRCLSEALYYEARGEGRDGQQAVAEVVFHRMNNGNYGHSICAVVYEGAGHPGCQFSFTCNGELAHRREEAAWRQSEQLAAEILTGEVRLKNATGGALNYHAVSVSPDWAPTLEKTTQIGNHVFYRGAPHIRDS